MKNKMNALQEQHDALHSKHERLKESATPRFRKKAVQYSELLAEFNEFIEQSHEDREAAEQQMSKMRNEIKELRAIRKQTRTRSGSLSTSSDVQLTAGGQSANRRRRKRLPRNFIRKKRKCKGSYHNNLVLQIDSGTLTVTPNNSMTDEFFEDDDCGDVSPALSEQTEDTLPSRLTVSLSHDERDSLTDDTDQRIPRPQTTRPRKRKPSLKSRGKQRRPQSSRSVMPNHESLEMSTCVPTSDSGAHTDSCESD